MARKSEGGRVTNRGGSGPLACPRCGEEASAAHFKTHPACASVVARLRAMLNCSRRKRVVAGPGRPKGSKNRPKALAPATSNALTHASNALPVGPKSGVPR
jgi:hypothetical protein